MVADDHRRMWLRRFGRLLAAGAAGLVLAGVVTAPASAHVHVSGTDLSQGGDGVLTFQVPTESARASTVGVTVTFPTDQPIVSAATQPVPGWSAKVITKKLARPVQTDDGPVDSYVAKINWKADSKADGIGPGEFEQFTVSAGPLPKRSSVVFPLRQYYSDGTTVNWDQEAASGGVEPDHPAPQLTLPAATGAGPEPAASPSTHPAGSVDGTGAPAASSTTWTAVAGLVAGILALIMAAIALLRTRPPTASE